jgi:hypothetical protein
MDVSMKYGIYKDRKSARMISSDFRMATGKKIDPEFVHWLAKRKGLTKHPYGNEVYYASNLRTVLDNSYATLYPIFLKEKEEKRMEKEKSNAVDYDPDKWIEGNRGPRFESIIRRVIKEEIEKTINEQ